MDIEKITLTQKDKYQTVIYPHFTNSRNVKGSVVILHGMAEHHDRYNEFAEYLDSHGYDVFLYDHRGHGKDKKYEELGHIAENNGYRLLISDALQVLTYIQNNNRGEKMILLGHSMGSLIARCVIAQYDDIDGAVILGTAQEKSLKTSFGCFLASAVKLLKSPTYRSPFLANSTTGYKNFARISNRTKFDWLTRDNSLVGAYINDPYCGYLCTASFYYDLIKITGLASSTKAIKSPRKDLPILVMSGMHDPVGNYGEGVWKYYSLLQKYGYTASQCILYDEARHELLNELNKEEVKADILKWIDDLGMPETADDDTGSESEAIDKADEAGKTNEAPNSKESRKRNRKQGRNRDSFDKESENDNDNE